MNEILMSKSIFSKTECEVDYIVPTYNRCPFPDPKKNPLTWCIMSLLNQKDCCIRKIILVNDFSDDYTTKTVQYLNMKNNTNIKIHIVDNSSRQGNIISKNIGLNYSLSQLVGFADDDTVYSSHFTYAATSIFEEYKHMNIGAISLPIYVRNIKPLHFKDIHSIGHFNLKEGTWCSNFDCYPKEYVSHPKLLNNKDIILPFEINLLNCTSIISRKALLSVNGWPDEKPFNHMESYILGNRLINKGYIFLHSPDPRYGLIHLKFGAICDSTLQENLDSNIEINGIDLNEMIRLSMKKRTNTGLRMEIDEYYYFENYSIAYFLFPITITGSFNFLERSFKFFVILNEPFSKTYPPTKLDKKNRFILWKRAIFDALNDNNSIPDKTKSILESILAKYDLSKL